MASALAALRFSSVDLEALMTEWRVATDAIFARKPKAGTSASGGIRNNHTVSSVRADWKPAVHLMPQFDQTCRALSVAEIHFLEWIYNYDPSDADRAALAETWRQWYMLASVDFVRCKEFFLRSQWLSVKASLDELEAADAAEAGPAAEADPNTETPSLVIDENGERKMFVRRLQVIFPLVARAMLCYAECQPRATRQAAAKRQAQEFSYCIDNMLCVEYGSLSTYSCSKLHRALKALATEWPRLSYDDQLQAYVEALMMRAAYLITVPETMTTHDVEHYRQRVEPDGSGNGSGNGSGEGEGDDDGVGVGVGSDKARPGHGAVVVAALSAADSIHRQQHQLYVVNDLLINYLAVTFVDMLSDLLMYSQFEVVDMRPSLWSSSESIGSQIERLLERRRQEKTRHREDYERACRERAVAGEQPLPPYEEIMAHIGEESEEEYRRIAAALCVDDNRRDATRAWMRAAEHDPSCNKSRRFIIANYCVWALRPGEIEVFRIDNANRSAAPRDVLRTMRGSTVKDALTSSNKRLGILIRDEMALQEHERQQQQQSQKHWPTESILLQLALYEYCNTGCYVHAQKLELQDYAIVHGYELESRFEELVYSEQPMLVRLFHHFQLAFRGVVYRYDSIVSAFSAWVELMCLPFMRGSAAGNNTHAVAALREKIQVAGRMLVKNRKRHDYRRKAARHQQEHDSAMSTPTTVATATTATTTTTATSLTPLRDNVSNNMASPIEVLLRLEENEEP